MGEISIETVSFAGWDGCRKITNGTVDLIATTEIGPRIIKFGFEDGGNEFWIDPSTKRSTGGKEWQGYGGHRLWHAPESMPRTYMPDNKPIDVEELKAGVKLTQPEEDWTQIQKEIEIKMSPSKPEVKVFHRLKNKGAWPIEIGPWALTLMDTGGKAIIPVPQGDPDDLLPNRNVSLWSYTDTNDPRLNWGTDYIFVQNDPEKEEDFKIGAAVPEEWAAYANNDNLFVKYFDYKENEKYPDSGCSVEFSTQGPVLEFETLAPLRKLEPKETVEYLETWKLIKNIPSPEKKKDIEEEIVPKI